MVVHMYEEEEEVTLLGHTELQPTTPSVASSHSFSYCIKDFNVSSSIASLPIMVTSTMMKEES